jgi:putative hydrolase of the HAD superfamily
MIRAIIYDLDNTLYPVKEFGNKMFAGLFSIITNDGGYNGELNSIKDDLMRIPFQKAADKYKFSHSIKEQATEYLKDLTYEGPIHTFSGYGQLSNIGADRYLVTAGFKKLQMSKIKGLNIKNDFKEIHIVDASENNTTKKDVMEDIMKRNLLQPHEIVVVGDDVSSEIKAATQLKMHAILFDGYGEEKPGKYGLVVKSFEELVSVVDKLS